MRRNSDLTLKDSMTYFGPSNDNTISDGPGPPMWHIKEPIAIIAHSLIPEAPETAQKRKSALASPDHNVEPDVPKII